MQGASGAEGAPEIVVEHSDVLNHYGPEKKESIKYHVRMLSQKEMKKYQLF